MKGRQYTGGRESENSAVAGGPATARYAIEVAVARQNEPASRFAAIWAGKHIKVGQRPGGCDFEDRAVAGGSADTGDTVKIAVGPSTKPPNGSRPVSPAKAKLKSKS